MKKPLLLWTAAAGFINRDLALLNSKFKVVVRPKINKKETIKILKEYCFSVWVVDTCPNFKIDRNILEHCSNLTVLASPATGSTHIDSDFVKLKKIKYISIKDRSIINKIYSSSEHAFALLLTSVRNIRPGMSSAFSGDWRKYENDLRTFELSEKKLGLIGFGRIGKNLSKYALSFNMKVGYFDPYQETRKRNIIKFKILKELYRWADIISVQVHLEEKTRGIINEKLISSSKSPKIIINISRGEVVNEESIIRNILNGKISKYATDVIANEQSYEKITENRIIKFGKKDNRVIVTPHTGGLSYDSEKKAAIDLIFQLIKLKF